MKDYDKEIVDDKLTQADLIKLMLHNAQHMATREEVKEDIQKVETSLKADMNKLEVSLRADMSKLETSLKADMNKLEASLKADISKIDAKFDKTQWLIIATMLTVVLKDYIFSFIVN